jgi:hypothetical protein
VASRFLWLVVAWSELLAGLPCLYLLDVDKLFLLDGDKLLLLHLLASHQRFSMLFPLLSQVLANENFAALRIGLPEDLVHHFPGPEIHFHPLVENTDLHIDSFPNVNKCKLVLLLE